MATAMLWYVDIDGDSYGNPFEAYAIEACADSWPEGYTDNPDDCDDLSSDTFPDAGEICDGEDNDCDGDTDEDPRDAPTWFRDADGDGYGAEDGDDTIEACEAPEGYAASDDDCDDDEPTTHPDAEDPVDGVDNDCDDGDGFVCRGEYDHESAIGCNTIVGRLNLDDADTTAGLESLTMIVGGFGMGGNAVLTNLDGLVNLRIVTDEFNIGDNPALTNLDGLSGLETVESSISISENDGLEDIGGLSSLTWVDDNLSISGNGALVTMDGLNNLVYVGGLNVDGNPLLTSLGTLDTLTTIDGEIWILDNAALNDIDGLLSVTDAGTEIYIRSNASLCSADVDAFRDALRAAGWDSAIVNEFNTGECDLDDDGVLESADCDDEDPESTVIATDADCDGIPDTGG